MSLGSLIAQARKSAGLSIEDLSALTSIRSALLREIESNNFTGCGGETYARGHIRNIAIKLEVDPQVFITAFEEEHVRPDHSLQNLLVENSVMREPQETRKVSWKVLATISVASLFVVGLAQIIVSNSSSTEIPDPISSVLQSESATPSSSPDPMMTSEATPTEQATVSTGTGVELVIFASRGKSWLFVSDELGRTLFSGQMAQGTTKTFTTDVSLNVKIGNAGGVDLTVNGKKVDSIGVDGEVVSVSYGVDS
jgi:cytoskeleton protein RodZ